MCHIFYACVDGTAEEYTCSSGLWFDEYSGVCNWPEVTDRKECKADAYGKISSLNVSVKGLSMNSRRLQNPVIAKEWWGADKPNWWICPSKWIVKNFPKSDNLLTRK